MVTAGTKRFDQGEWAGVVAHSNSGWRFVRWSGELSGSSNRETVRMNGNKTVTAHWERIPATTYTLRAIADPANGSGGYVEISGGTSVTAGTKRFNQGVRATVEARPSSGWRFVRWSGSLAGSSARQTLTMNGNKTVTALFERMPAPTYTLRAIADPSDGSGGYVEISGGTLVTAGTKRFNQGERATVEARSNSGWRFVRWSGDLSGSSARQTLTMNGNKTVTALFERMPAPTYTLRAIADPSDGSGGYVEISGGTLVTAGTKRFDQGERATVEARSNSGWRFVRWSGDLSGSSARQTLTMNGNKTVTAHWERIPATTYTLRAIADPANGSGGYVEISGGTSVTAGTKRFDQGVRATVEARSNSGWRFVRWSGDLSGSSARQTLTMNGNKTVTALFERMPAPTYTLRAIADPSDGSGGYVEISGGTLVTAGTKRFNQGERATVEARSNSGWRFVRWSGDLSGSSARQTLTMNGNKTVTAHWERIPATTYTLRAIADPSDGSRRLRRDQRGNLSHSRYQAVQPG